MANKEAMGDWKSGKGKAVTSLVLGIISCVGALGFYIGWVLSLACGIPAIVFGALGKCGEKRGLAIAGFVLGIVGTSLGAILLIGASLWFWLVGFH